MSSISVKAPPTAPKANMRVLPMKKAMMVVMTALITLIMFSIGWSLLGNGASSKEVKYSEFITELEAGNVDEIELKGSIVSYTLKQEKKEEKKTAKKTAKKVDTNDMVCTEWEAVPIKFLRSFLKKIKYENLDQDDALTFAAAAYNSCKDEDRINAILEWSGSGLNEEKIRKSFSRNQ